MFAIPWQHGAEPVPPGRLLQLAIAAAALIFASSIARAADVGAAAPTAPTVLVAHD